MTVPTGTVQDVLDWVGDDPDRAQEALDAERVGQNRSTLVSQLEATAASEPKEDSAVTDTATAQDYEDQTDEETGLAPAAEQPVEVVLHPNAGDTTVGVVYRRDFDVEVPDGTDLTPEDTDDLELEIEAEQVEYFQVVGSPNGCVVAINGTAFALLPQTALAFKGAIDRAIAGTVL